jgi:hypothetical protein
MPEAAAPDITAIIPLQASAPQVILLNAAARIRPFRFAAFVPAAIRTRDFPAVIPFRKTA